MNILVICIVLGFTGLYESYVYAQSPLSSAKSEGSLMMDDRSGNGFVQVNFTQPSFTLAFQKASNKVNRIRLHDPNEVLNAPDTPIHLADLRRVHFVPIYGLQLQANAAGKDTATLFEEKDLAVGGKVSLSLTVANLFSFHPSAQELQASDIPADIRVVTNAMAPLTPVSPGSEVTRDQIERISSGQINLIITRVEAELEDVKSHIQALGKDYLVSQGITDRQLTNVVTAIKDFTELVRRLRDAQKALEEAQKARGQDRIAMAEKAVKAQLEVLAGAWPHVNVALHPFTNFGSAPWGPGYLTWDTLTLRGGYIRDQYRLLEPTAALGSQIKKQNFNGWSVSLAYNAQFTSTGAINERAQQAGKISEKSRPDSLILFGIALGAAKKNNSDDLTRVDVEDQVFTSQNGTTIRAATKTQKALLGNYKEVTDFTLDTDIIWKPQIFDSNYRLGIDLFLRSNYASKKEMFNPGIGLFLSPKGRPLQVIGAVSVVRRSGNNVEVDLVAGAHF